MPPSMESDMWGALSDAPRLPSTAHSGVIRSAIPITPGHDSGDPVTPDFRRYDAAARSRLLVSL